MSVRFGQEYAVLLIIFVLSCKDEENPKPTTNKDYVYVVYDSPINVSHNDSLLIDLNYDSLMDLIIKSSSTVNQTDTFLLNELFSLHDSLKLSFGTRYSSVFNFISLGDTISISNVHWTMEIPISGYYNGSKTGVWVSNGKYNGYIATKLSDNKFGWIGLECSDSSISIVDYYMQKKNQPFLVINELVE